MHKDWRALFLWPIRFSDLKSMAWEDGRLQAFYLLDFSHVAESFVAVELEVCWLAGSRRCILHYCRPGAMVPHICDQSLWWSWTARCASYCPFCGCWAVWPSS